VGSFIEALGILGVVDLEEEAEHMGLEFARASVDNHAKKEARARL
jgi:hypothetical protein